jgi:hypothetical protein
MESKTIFKEKDIVYVTSLGWGMVIDAGCSTPDGWVGIETNSGRIIHVDTYLVSFTEYTLEGFSQDRLPERGEVVWVRSANAPKWVISHFIKKDDSGYYCVNNANIDKVGYYGRYTQLTTTNPYLKNKPTKQ